MATMKGDRRKDRCSGTRKAIAIQPPPVSVAATSDYSQAFSGGPDNAVVQDRSPHTNTTAASSSQ